MEKIKAISVDVPKLTAKFYGGRLFFAWYFGG
jgi:hypothetical protein